MRPVGQTRPQPCLRSVAAPLACAALLVLSACTPPIRQYDLREQPLTCAQANKYALRTLQLMNFTITQFDPATPERRGTLRGARDEVGRERVTVVITCDGHTADVNASEDGKWLGQIEFKRGFYLSFTSVATQAALTEAAAREAAARPPEERKRKGLQVLLEPVRGLGAKLDFDLDLAAAGVLPVRVTIDNGTSRTYHFAPMDVALIQKDGTRVRPLPVARAARRVADAERQSAAADAAPPAPDEIARRLEGHLLKEASVAANQTARGYLYFPLAPYVKGRVSLEDQETEETEGFLVEF